MASCSLPPGVRMFNSFRRERLLLLPATEPLSGRLEGGGSFRSCASFETGFLDCESSLTLDRFSGFRLENASASNLERYLRLSLSSCGILSGWVCWQWSQSLSTFEKMNRSMQSGHAHEFEGLLMRLWCCNHLSSKGICCGFGCLELIMG